MSNNNSKKNVLLYISITLTTMSIFVYETLLTRLISTILSQGLVFLVVSFAILGGGIGAILTYKLRKERDQLLLESSMLLPFSFIISVAIMYFLPFNPTFFIYIPVAIFPFIIGGITTSIIFMKKGNQSNKLYLMDLLGAGVGSLFFIRIMNSYGFLKSVLIVVIIAMMASIGISLYYKKTRSSIISLGFIVIISLLFMSNNLMNNIEGKFYSYYSSPFKFINTYNKHNLETDIVFTKWDSISRTDVIELEGEEDKYIITDGGAAAPIKKFNGDLSEVQEMKNDANYIPFSFGSNERSLVIGSGGGNDVLYALLGGNKEIDAVEINPSTIEAVNEFKKFNGDIYNYPGVNLYIQDGRYFIENSTEKYDNIYLSKVMTNSVDSTMYSLAEYYIFTEEAVSQYLNHLTENGKLTFVAHDSKDLSKIVNTGIKVLLDKGIEASEVTKYFTVINGITSEQSSSHGDQIVMPVVIFKNNPFTQAEVDLIKAISNLQGRELVQVHGQEVESDSLMKEEKINFKQLIGSYNYNVSPTKDDKPFFYNYSKFVPMEMILILFFIFNIIIKIKKKYLGLIEQNKASLYFGAIGIAYMLVEIPLIQKMVLYFGSSSIAFSIILFSLSISSGIGSLISGTELVEKRTTKYPYYILISGVLIIVNQLVLGTILDATKGFELTYKFWVVLISIFPMGFFMGMAYPSGIQKISKLEENGNIVPLMIGVNGVSSVLGSTLAVTISMVLGFSNTLLIGAGIYIMLFLLNPLNDL